MRRTLLSVTLSISMLFPVAASAMTSKAESFNAMNAQQKEDFVRHYLPRKSVLNHFMSGEVATFARDGRLIAQWGLDYAGPNDTRPHDGVGSWSITDGKIVIAKTAISDGEYPIADLMAFIYKRKLVLYACGSYGPFFGAPRAWWRSLDNAARIELGEVAEKSCK